MCCLPATLFQPQVKEHSMVKLLEFTQLSAWIQASNEDFDKGAGA